MSVNQKTENGLVKLAGLYGSQRITPNPTLAGTEGDLTGIQFGNTKYKVPSSGGGGGQIYPEDSTPIVLQTSESGTWYRKYLTGTTANDGVIMTLTENQTYINAFGLLKRNDVSYNLPSCLGSNNDWYCSTYVTESTGEIKLLAGNVLRSSTYYIYVDYFEAN